MRHIQTEKLCGGLAVFPVFLIVSGSWWLAIAASLIGYLTVSLANDWRIAVFGPMLGISTVALFALFLSGVGALVGIELGTLFVALAVILVWILVAQWWGKHTPSKSPAGCSWLVVVVFGLTAHALTRDWGRANTLNLVQTMGEDHGFFLKIVAEVSQTGSMDLQTSAFSGGSVVSATAAFGAGLRRLSPDDQISSAIGVAETLQRMYYGLIYVVILTAGSIVISMRSRQQAVLDIATVLVTAGTVLAFSSGLMRGGHYSSLVAVALVVCLLLVIMSMESLTKPRVIVSIPILLVIALWQAWTPLFLVSITVVFWLGTYQLRVKSRSVPRASLSIWMTLASILAFAAVYMWLNDLWQLQWNDFTMLMEPTGGEARVFGWFAVLVQVVVLLSLGPSRNTISAIRSAVVSSLCVSATLLMILGWFLPPYEPAYGPHKYLYLVTFAIAPLAIGWFRRQVESQSVLVVVTLVIVAIGGVLQAAVTPLSELSLRVSSSGRAEWEQGAIIALNSFPERDVLCMETREDGDREYEAYRCTRLLNGMQGSDRNFSNWNLCYVPSSEVAEVSDSEWQNLTILVSDGNRLSSTDGCQSKGWAGEGIPDNDKYLLGWATGIRWDLVKIVSYDGRVVNPDFEYLRQHPQYSDSEILGLRNRLAE